ncbi:MAG: YihY/virulence factor BrkB family protein [Chloroflexi bacterium]|nr:MAG: YihY/virulence factor BrkB family protein [Chloroflexota bacterium]
MPELRKETAPLDRSRCRGLQGFRLVQNGQPCAGQERGQARNQVREQGRDENGREVRDEGKVRGQELSEERGVILARAVARARATIVSFAADDCPFLAGAVAYQIFFALIPLLALLVGVLAFAYGPDRAENDLVQILRDIYPSATSQEARIAHQLVQGRALSLSIGVIGTIFSTMAIHGALDRALAMVLGREGRRSFVRGHLEAAGFVAALAVLALVSFGLSFGTAALSDALVGAGFGGIVWVAVRFLSPLAGLAVGLVFFYVVYRVVPRRRPSRRAAVEGALVSAVLWEIAKLAFGYFTRALALFAAYGPLAFAAGLLTWIYVTALIILFGAEVMKTRGTA